MNLQDQLRKKVFVPSFFVQTVLVHLGALAALPFFSVKAFLFAFSAAAVFGYAMGIFHHMQLSHGSFDCHPILRRFGALLGTLTWRGPFAGPVKYAALHRIHHAYSDTELDPHSPETSLWHSFMGWFWRHSPLFLDYSAYSPLAKKVAEDRWLAWMDQNVNLLQFFWGLLCFGGAFGWSCFAGSALGEALSFGLQAVLFGVFVKTFLVIYLVNLVDVINHTVGYRNVETRDSSTNSFLMFALHLGGAVSWHNNHHARASYFSVKYRWWEFDLHLLMLRLLSVFGLVSNIKALSFVDGNRQPVLLAPSGRGA